MTELSGMRSNPLWPSLPGPLWFTVKKLDRALSMGRIELFDHLNRVQTNDFC